MTAETVGVCLDRAAVRHDPSHAAVAQVEADYRLVLPDLDPHVLHFGPQGRDVPVRLREPRPQVQHAGIGLVRHQVGEPLGDLAAVQHLELASEPPPHVPKRRGLCGTRLRGQVQASDLVEAVPIQDPAETLEQVEADRPCAHLGLRAHQHRNYAAGLEAGAAAHGALVYNYDALHALFDKVEGGAQAGYPGPDHDDGLRSGE